MLYQPAGFTANALRLSLGRTDVYDGMQVLPRVDVLSVHSALAVLFASLQTELRLCAQAARRRAAHSRGTLPSTRPDSPSVISSSTTVRHLSLLSAS